MTDLLKPRPGEIWQLRFSNLTGVIVCAWEQAGEPDDLRIVPLEMSDGALSAATDRDVVLHAPHSSLGMPLLAQAWNARTVSADDLLVAIGTVAADALEAIRRAEMLGIVPTIADELAGWLGPRPGSSQEMRDAGVRESLAAWDDALGICALFRTSLSVAMDRAQFTGRKMTGSAMDTMGTVTIAQTVTGEFRVVNADLDSLLSEAA